VPAALCNLSFLSQSALTVHEFTVFDIIQFYTYTYTHTHIYI